MTTNIADEYADGNSRPSDAATDAMLARGAARAREKLIARLTQERDEARKERDAAVKRARDAERDFAECKELLEVREAELVDAREQHADDQRAIRELREKLQA